MPLHTKHQGLKVLALSWGLPWQREVTVENLGCTCSTHRTGWGWGWGRGRAGAGPHTPPGDVPGLLPPGTALLGKKPGIFKIAGALHLDIQTLLFVSSLV